MQKLPLTLALILTTLTATHAQTYIKLNGQMAAIGIFNPAVEVKLSEKFTFQMDATVSPWHKYLLDAPFVVAMGAIDTRWYPKGSFNGFYVGPTIAFASFKMQRPDYWRTSFVQYGSTIFYGLDLGYVITHNRWSFEPFVAYGWALSHYEGYDIIKGNRYDAGTYPGELNASAEWIPFKGGLMIGYRF